MKRVLHWLSPGDPTQRTGGYLYNARMVTELRQRGWQVEIHVLEGAWPWPCGANLQQAQAQLARIPRGEPVLADGLLWPGLGEVRGSVAGDHPVVVLVHSLLDKEGGGDAARMAQLETAALDEADAWVATSPATGRLVSDRLGPDGPPGDVVCPGTEPARRAPGTEGHNLLCVATITPRKGIRLLVEAVAGLEDPEWRLDVVGSMDRDHGYAAEVQRDIEARGLTARVKLHGELADEALEAAYQQADILVHAAHFEAFGMGLAEAIVRGIPVISTPAGALEVLPQAAVEEVPAGNAAALTAAMDALLQSPEAQHRMGDAAAAAKVATWSESAAALESALEAML